VDLCSRNPNGQGAGAGAENKECRIDVEDTDGEASPLLQVNPNPGAVEPCSRVNLEDKGTSGTETKASTSDEDSSDDDDDDIRKILSLLLENSSQIGVKIRGQLVTDSE
jgi:hypothetical protein